MKWLSLALFLLASDGALVGPQGAPGNAGPKGPDGVAQPAGVGVACGGNGLRVVSDALGTHFICAPGNAHHLEALAAAPTTTQNATVLATGDATRAAVVAANPTGPALKASPRVDLDVGGAGAVSVPFVVVRDYHVCNTGGLDCNYLVMLDCPAGHRALSVGCDAVLPINRLRRALRRKQPNGAYIVADDTGVPNAGECSVSVDYSTTNPGSLSSYVVCMREAL